MSGLWLLGGAGIAGWFMCERKGPASVWAAFCRLLLLLKVNFGGVCQLAV
jgi:hypothetical protein